MVHNRAFMVVAAILLLGQAASAAADKTNDAAAGSAVVNAPYANLQWKRTVPELGERSSEMTILHTDPVTKSTQLMIRFPPNYHMPAHWHSANETHTVIEGTFIVEAAGKRAELAKGSFNYTPAKLPHEAWTPPGEGALVYMTMDSADDIHWVNGEPKPHDYGPGLADHAGK